MKDDDFVPSTDLEGLGLCTSCLHIRIQSTRRGARFYRCARADEDERFARYPPIPVRRCRGHEMDDPQSE